MERENELKNIVSENIVKYRKANNMTQLQFAEKLDYTDKAISKWERGESIPDLYVLMRIVDMFGITLNDLVTKQEKVEPKQTKKKVSHFFISLLSCGLVWLVATLSFIVLKIAHIDYHCWMVFIYALPLTSIVATVFTCIWGKHMNQLIAISTIFYTVPLAIFLELYRFQIKDLWMVFLIAVPLQILIIFWYLLKHNKGKKVAE